MTPTWIYVPDEGSSGLVTPDYQLDATTVAGSNSDRRDLTSTSESGSAAGDFEVYPLSTIRRYSNYLETLLRLSTGGSFSSLADFNASTSNLVTTFSIGGNVISVATIATSTQAAGSRTGTVVRFRWFVPSATLATYWANVASSGEAFQLTLNYDGT